MRPALTRLAGPSRLISRRLDAIVAAVVVVVGVVEVLTDHLHPLWVAVPAAVLAGASLALRRRWPMVTVVCCFGALAVNTWAGVPLSAPVVPIVWILISEYSIARHRDLRLALIGLGVGLAFFAATLPRDSSDLGFGLVLICAPWLVGLAMRSRVAQTETIAGRAEQLERRRDQDARAAAAAERGRIARDLHDVIAHSVSVMVVQAAGAEQVLPHDPQRATVALQQIQTTGRAALTEISALLGILRRDGEQIGMARHPGMADLPTLIAQARDAGLPVELCVTGQPHELPPGVELSIYRIVQEALTNTRKHARATHAVVSLDYTPDAVCLQIVDSAAPGPTPGRMPGARPGPGAHNGIIGMRERVAVYGGTLTTGPQPSGGFAVRARIPVPTP